MNRAPAFQFYPDDWLSSPKISTMTPAEEGAYIRLLSYSWNDPDCTIPDDDTSLAMLSRLGEGWLNGSGNKLRACFVQHSKKTGRLFNVRLMKERKKQEDWRKKSQQGGKRSAESRASRSKDHPRVVEECFKGGSILVEPKGNSSSSSPPSSSIKKEEEEGRLSPEVFSVEEVLKNWNQIPGAKPIEFERLTPGRGLHKRIVTMTAAHKHDAREWWGTVFESVRAQQHFLFSGENQRNWTAHLAWVLGPENLAKVLERRYEDIHPKMVNGSGQPVTPSVNGTSLAKRVPIPV